MVGSHNLHKNVAIVCAGNLETDNAIVQPMSTALQSRLVHMELMVDAKEWVNWASQNGIDYRITSYINWKPGNLFTFRPDHTDKTYACPRTWEFAHRVLQVTEDDDTERLPMLAGTLSEGIAREFMGFTAIHKDLPKLESIINNPENIAVPQEPSILYALTGAVAQNANKENIDSLIKYVSRMPAEFQVVCLREVKNRNPDFLQIPAVLKWITKFGSEMF